LGALIFMEWRSDEMEIDAEPAWTMDDGAEQARRVRNAEALTDCMNRLGARRREGGGGLR
jgi:hypothetical protein